MCLEAQSVLCYFLWVYSGKKNPSPPTVANNSNNSLLSQTFSKVVASCSHHRAASLRSFSLYLCGKKCYTAGIVSGEQEVQGAAVAPWFTQPCAGELRGGLKAAAALLGAVPGDGQGKAVLQRAVLCGAGGWTPWSFCVPFNSRHSVILWFFAFYSLNSLSSTPKHLSSPESPYKSLFFPLEMLYVVKHLFTSALNLQAHTKIMSFIEPVLINFMDGIYIRLVFCCFFFLSWQSPFINFKVPQQIKLKNPLNSTGKLKGPQKPTSPVWTSTYVSDFNIKQSWASAIHENKVLNDEFNWEHGPLDHDYKSIRDKCKQTKTVVLITTK